MHTKGGAKGMEKKLHRTDELVKNNAEMFSFSSNTTEELAAKWLTVNVTIAERIAGEPDPPLLPPEYSIPPRHTDSFRNDKPGI